MARGPGFRQNLPVMTLITFWLTYAAIAVMGIPNVESAPERPLVVEAPHAAVVAAAAGTPWINELHYDNDGTDTGEGVEVAGMAGTDLSIYTLVLYNGANGQSYSPTTPLTGVIDDEGSGGGAVWFPIANIQNGAPDGIALVNTVTNTVVQFLSYEGSFAATNGAAAGQTSVDIGVSETTSTPVGQSLQLIGTGDDYADFTWTGPVAASPGTLNAGQTFQMAAGNQPPNAGTARLGVALPTSGGAACPDAVSVSAAAGDTLAVDDFITVAGLGVPVPTSAEVSDDTTPDAQLRVVVTAVTITPGSCSTDVAITYVLLDNEGAQSAPRTDTFVVTDDEPPVFTAAPGALDTTIAITGFGAFAAGPCATDVDLAFLVGAIQDGYPGFTPLTLPLATDNCSSIDYAVTAMYLPGTSTCAAAFDVAVTATDACGQSATPYTLRVQVTSASPPVLPPGDTVATTTSAGFDCLNPVFAVTTGSFFSLGATVDFGNGVTTTLPVASAFGGCIGDESDFILTAITPLSGNACTQRFGFTFSFDTNCPQAVAQDYVVVLELTDDTPPIVTAPAGVTLSCTQDPTDPQLTGTATATDNCSPLPSAPLVAAGQVFINEFHYDNTGTDVGEFVEIAGPAGTDLSTYSVVLYNGSNGAPYQTIALAGAIDDEGSGFGALSFGAVGIQNGAPDAIALCGPMGVLEFLSYEGTFTAAGGCASGVTSTDVGVEETSGTPVGTSIQRLGSGANGGDFGFVTGMPESPGSINANQTIMSPGGGGGNVGGPIATTFSDVVLPGSCPNAFQIQRTFTAVDACGNVGSALQIINVVDTSGPVFAQAPGSLDVTVTTTQLAAQGLGNCAATIDAANLQLGLSFAILFGQTSFMGLPIPSATDSCGTTTLTVARIVTGNAQGPGPCALDIVVTFSASDACGNASEFVNRITVIDNEAPVVSPNFQTAVTLACGSATDTTATGFPVFYDNCGSSAPSTASAFINEIHYDNAGADVDEFVEVAGAAGTDLAGWSLVLYNGSNNAPYNTLALSGILPDEGNGGGALAFFYPPNGIQNGSPDGVALVNASGTVVEFLSYEGSMTGVGGPADGIAATPIPVSEDGSGPSTESLQRIGAGNAGSGFTFVGPRPNSPGALNAGQTYLAAQNVTIGFSESVATDPSCTNGQVITRTFVANDGCGNLSTVTQTITVTDTVAPVFVGLPGDTTIACASLSGGFTLANLSGFADGLGVPQVVDNCGPTTVAAFADAFAINPTCPNGGTFTRTFAAVDDGCGNVLPAAVLTVTVIDTVAPMFVGLPGDTTIACASLSGGVTLANLSSFADGLGVPQVVDNCGPTAVAAFTDALAINPMCPNGGTFTRTFAAVDDGCGNVLPAAVLTVTVIDTVAPMFVGLPGDTTIACASLSGGVTLANLSGFADGLGVPQVVDNCGPTTVAAFTDAFAINPMCPNGGTFTRTFAAVDDGCGNVLPAAVLTVTVIDTVAPVFVGFPADTTVACEGVGGAVALAILAGFVDGLGAVTVADDCGAGAAATFTDAFVADPACPTAGVFSRSFDAVDDGCGNVLPARTLTVTVVDTVGPVISGLPTATDFPCETGLPDLGGVTLDDCDPTAAITFVDVVDASGALGLGRPGVDGVVAVVSRTYTASDACGNATTAVRALRIVDPIAPVLLSCPAAIGPIRANSAAGATVTFDVPTFDDNCGFTVEGTAASGDEFPVGTTTVTYVATDLGGNATVCAFDVTVVRTLVIDCGQVDVSVVDRSDETRAPVNFPYAETTCTRCPQGTPLPGLDYLGYFEGHRYYVSAPGFANGWLGAQYYAVDLGGRVAQIDSEAENRFIAGELPYDVAHIGLLRDQGATEWRGTFSSTDYRNWAPGEPIADPHAKYALIRKSDGRHLARRDTVIPYVLEFPCVDFEVDFFPADSLFGVGTNNVVYTAIDQCGNRDTCHFQVNVTPFEVLYCAPAVLRDFPREEQVDVTRVAIGAFARTIAPSDVYLHTRDTIEVQEDNAVALSLRAETTGVEADDFTAYWRVWVDANGDGDFYDAGELIFQGVGGASLDSTLTVPSGSAVVSPTRLRVAVGRYDWPEACGESPFIDHEDFTVVTDVVRRANIVLTGKNLNGVPTLAADAKEGPEVDRYLLLRGERPDGLSKYGGWPAVLRNGERYIYESTDLDPVLRAFYQVVSLGSDGLPIDYSNVVEIELPIRRGPRVKTYPNPASHHLTLERVYRRDATDAGDDDDDDGDDDWDVILHDALGRRVLERRWPASSPRIELRMPTLPTGTYFLQTVDPSGATATERVIIDQSATQTAPRA